MLVKIKFAILFFFFPLGKIYTQNLIPNPSFEDYKYLSCNMSDFIEDFVEHWSQPLGTSTDYWHLDQYSLEDECDRMFRVPPLSARSGSAMVGIVTYEYVKDNIFSNYKEYLHTKLLKPIRKDKVYNVTFYYRTENQFGWVTNNLGFYFSQNFIMIKAAIFHIYLMIRNLELILFYRKRINGRKFLLVLWLMIFIVM